MYNSIPTAYGALPFFGELWAVAPLFVFFITLGVDYGMINALMDGEDAIKQSKVRRVKYLTFRVNDTIVIPPFLALCAWVMQSHPNPQGWYTERWWHWTALGASLAMSLIVELMSVKDGAFTWRQEIGPSKLYHTLIFGVMGYWMFTGLAAALANGWHDSVLTLIIWGVVSWGWVVFAAEPRWLRKQGRKTPVNAHPEIGRNGLHWLDDPS